MGKIRDCDLCGKKVQDYYHVEQMHMGQLGGRRPALLSDPKTGKLKPTQWDLCAECYPLLLIKTPEEKM